MQKWLTGENRRDTLGFTKVIQIESQGQESESKQNHKKGEKCKRKKGARRPQYKKAEVVGGLFPAARACGSFYLRPDSFRERIPVLLPDFPDEAVCGAEKLSVHLPE